MSNNNAVISENKMGVVPENKLLLSMAIPMMISMLVQALYNVVDSVFVSRISEDALTAVSLSFPMQNLLIAVGVGFGVGVNALLSRYLGEKRTDAANLVAMQGILLAIGSYILFLLIGLFAIDFYMRSQIDIQQIIDYGTQYLRICCIYSFGVFAQIIFERLLQSTGRTMLCMATQLTGAVINIVLDPILIFGLLGFPKMGIAGAAIATVTGQIIGAAMAAVLNLTKNKEIQLRLVNIKPNINLLKRIMVISVPSIVMASISSVMTFILNIILVAFTETAAAVFGVYFKLQSFVFMPVFGLNNGMVPIVAYNYGARNNSRVLKTMRLGIIYAVCIMLIGLTVFQVFPATLLRLFDASADMIEIGVPALRIISLSFIFAGYCIISSSVCQALGYSIYSLWLSLLRQICVLVPAAYLLSLTGVLRNVWFSFPIAEIVSVVIATVFIRHVLKKAGITADNKVNVDS